jgi:hypothetical protein
VSVSVCPACSQENPDVARFCLHCGAALGTEPHREERRVVSVLFVDIVGFTSRAEQLDPEDVRSFLTPYYERLRAEIQRHGGRIEKFVPLRLTRPARRSLEKSLVTRDGVENQRHGRGAQAEDDCEGQ